MLHNCQTCKFYAPARQTAIELGCAVNPPYWLEWQQARARGRESSESGGSISCRDYEEIEQQENNSAGMHRVEAEQQNQASSRSTAEKLMGIWDYQVSIAQRAYRLEIGVDENGELRGRYLIPSDNNSRNSRFEIRIYESSERGRPVLSIVQNHASSPYYAVLSGRMEQDDLITGNFIDLDNNRGSFRLMKRQSLNNQS